MRRPTITNITSYDDPEQRHSDSILLPATPNTASKLKKKRKDASISYAMRVPGRLLKHSAKQKQVTNATGKKAGAWRKKSLSTPILIVAWYVLGVVSISSSKILLTEIHMNPLALSVQQFGKGVVCIISNSYH